MHIVSVVGARPQFVKLAPISRVFASMKNVQHTIVHTGQHYDDNMSSVFFTELEIPLPDVNLDIGSGGHAVQTGRMMEQLELWFLKNSPDLVLVYGDTNSTLAASITAAKIHIPVAHIEAGLRSFNRSMPEEINRIATDHCSDRLYSPTPAGMHNLETENLLSRALLSGDVMRDAVVHSLDLAERKSVDTISVKERNFGVLTLHRPSNTAEETLVPLLKTLDRLSGQYMPLIFPVHPRTRNIMNAAGLSLSANIRLVEPLPYLTMLQTVKKAAVVLTDSGGLQKEAAFLGTQCITLRDETEWTETVEIGVNRLVGTDETMIFDAFGAVSSTGFTIDDKAVTKIDEIFGTGRAANIIAEDVIEFFA